MTAHDGIESLYYHGIEFETLETLLMVPGEAEAYLRLRWHSRVDLLQRARYSTRRKLAYPPRLELRLSGPKPLVLPLHHGYIWSQRSDSNR